MHKILINIYCNKFCTVQQDDQANFTNVTLESEHMGISLETRLPKLDKGSWGCRRETYIPSAITIHWIKQKKLVRLMGFVHENNYNDQHPVHLYLTYLKPLWLLVLMHEWSE